MWRCPKSSTAVSIAAQAYDADLAETGYYNQQTYENYASKAAAETGYGCKTPEDAVNAVNELLDMGCDGIKTSIGRGMDGKSVPMETEKLRAIADTAKARGVWVSCHVLDAEFIPALIAFIIIWIIMAKMAWPMIIGTLDARQEKIQSDLDAAAKAQADAEEAKAVYQAKLEEADRKADAIMAEAKRDAEVMRADMIAKAQEESQAIIAKAHDVIDAERAKAMSELSGSVVDLSVEIASKVIGDALDEDQQRKLAAKYLAEVGSLNDD